MLYTFSDIYSKKLRVQLKHFLYFDCRFYFKQLSEKTKSHFSTHFLVFQCILSICHKPIVFGY